MQDILWDAGQCEQTARLSMGMFHSKLTKSFKITCHPCQKGVRADLVLVCSINGVCFKHSTTIDRSHESEGIGGTKGNKDNDM